MKTLLEIKSDFTTLNIYADYSLSEIAGELEDIPGIVLVTQPDYNHIEAFIDTKYQRDLAKQAELEATLAKYFKGNHVEVEYVRYE